MVNKNTNNDDWGALDSSAGNGRYPDGFLLGSDGNGDRASARMSIDDIANNTGASVSGVDRRLASVNSSSVDTADAQPMMLDLSSLPPGMKVTIENTNTEIKKTVNGAVRGTESFAQTRDRLQRPQQRVVDSPEPTDSSEQARFGNSIDDDVPSAEATEDEAPEEPVVKKKKKKSKKKKKTKKPGAPNLERAQNGVKKAASWVNELDKDDNGGWRSYTKAGLIGGAAGLAPSYYFGSGLSTLTTGAALGAVGALALPAIGYIEGKRKGDGSEYTRAALGGGVSVAGLAAYNALGGSALSAIGSTAGAIALPAGLAYAGYKLGAKNGKPWLGALTGLGGGMVAAPVVSSAISAGAGGWVSAAGGAALGLGSTVATAGGIGLGAAGLYGLGHLNKKLGVKGLSNQKSGVFGTALQGLALPISAVVRGGQWAGGRIQKWREGRRAAAEAPSEGTAA